MVKLINSSNEDRAALRLLVATAVAMFEVFSKNLPGFHNNLIANCFPALVEILVKFLTDISKPSACIVLKLTVTVLFSNTN